MNRPYLTKLLVEAHGEDPTLLTQEPPEPKPEPPNISFRFSSEDMLNPMSVALLMKQYEITPEEIKAAAMMIKDAMQQIQVAQPPPPDAGGSAGPAPQGELPPVEPPETTEPILKRANDGSRLV